MDATADDIENRLIRVAIANEQPLARLRFEHISTGSEDVVVVGEAEDAHQAMRLAGTAAEPPDVIVIDTGLSREGGIDVARRIHARYPSVGIVMSGGREDWRDVAEAVEAGARGYLLDSDEPERVAATLRVVAAGGDTLEGHRAWLALQARPAPGGFGAGATADTPAPLLTARQIEVLQRLRAGRDEGDAAERLGISTSTLRAHERRIAAKLRLPDRADVAAYADRHDYLLGRGADYIGIWDLRRPDGPAESFPENSVISASLRLRELRANESRRPLTGGVVHRIRRGWRRLVPDPLRLWL
jgi:DNA-binding NarL/FixJ family response regulator